MLYVNCCYSQFRQFVNFNNKLDTVDSKALDMIRELRNISHGKFDIVDFSNNEINDIFISLCCDYCDITICDTIFNFAYFNYNLPIPICTMSLCIFLCVYEI